ncbi:Predicted arabinose efflux permease, MFS family [Streptosporangium subroseum]|uniref:Predicted arabinose efflux permease, MFS family n=1 Tax=Streptosporangium subroseum TaxID=106412 RepID=A0A239KPN6_9ACTN|nr:MFS transporter [Streptosporangium subroseum]SNT20025.1 Predicted arabinose efflux permease, MFS family [Streptosporangium subroseum]
MSPAGRVVGLLLTSQALRGLGYGIAAVQLGAILRLDGLTPAEVGLMLAAILVGTLAASLALARWGDRAGRRRTYAALYGALVCAGIVIAFGAPPWLLAVVAMTGALSVEVMESGPFTTLEQVMLASTGRPQRELVRGFGLYNAVAAVAGTVGALLGALPADRRLLGGVLAVVGAAGVVLAARLPASVEAPAAQPGLPRSRMLARSRGPVARLAALFAVDSLAGGFVVQAYLGYWLSLRYGATTQTIGITFAVLGVLQTASLLAAPLVAARVGLLRTMVFTHIPSNLLLAAVPFAPGLGGAIALLMARACLSQMDVPTRQAYVMALVPADERTAAAAVTNTARYLTRPAGPALAGLMLPFGLALPFVIAGAVKTAYDLTLWRIFRSVRLPADQHSSR